MTRDLVSERISDENQLRGDRGFRRGVLDAWCAVVWRAVRPAMDGLGGDYDGTGAKHESCAAVRHFLRAEFVDRVRARAIVLVEECEYRGARCGDRRIALDRHR